MSLKFEGETLEALRSLKERLRLVEKAVNEIKTSGVVTASVHAIDNKEVPFDEVSSWLAKRRKEKLGRL